MVVERLKTVFEKQDKLSEKERMDKFIRESGLFASPENKLGPELKKLSYPVSPERRAELAKKASIGKPLSQIIIEEREEAW